MLKKHYTQLDLKKLTDEGQFEGYGAVFNNVDMTGDVILPGAFRNCLLEKPLNAIKLLWQHDHQQPIGKWEEIREDDHGLFVRGQILTTIQRGVEVMAMLKAGIVDGMSIGFRTIKSIWEEGTDYRQLAEVDLWEVSVVTFPANMRARVDTVKMTLRDAEHVLREGGMPSNFAKLVAKHGFEEAQRIVQREQRDAEPVGLTFTNPFA